MITGDTITAPIGLGDICRLLRERTMDLGSLCQSKTINKWAKYKPVSNYELEYEDELTTTRDGWKDTATWWKGTDGQCGIANIRTLSADDLKAADMATLFADSWTYNPPSGTAASPFRAEDFLLYRRTAQSPFGKIKAYPSTDIKYYQGGSVMRWVITPHTPESDELALTDIAREFGTSTSTISEMWFGMVFICVKASNPNDTDVIGKTLVKTCESAIGNGGTTLELTTADTVQFASQLANDETYWIAYPILLSGSAQASMVTIANINSKSNLLFAPYKEVVVEAASPYKFLPSEYDAQARFTAVVMGTTNYFEFTLSIVNKSGESKTVAQLADAVLKLTYTTATDAPSDWSKITTAYTYPLSSALNLQITRQSADNTITQSSLSSGWTIEAGDSVTITGRIEPSSTSEYSNMKHAQLSCNIKYSGDSDYTEYAAGQNSYWHAESDGQQVATNKTHTATLEVVSTYLSGSQMTIRFTPKVTAKSGTATTSWSAADLVVTVNVQYGVSRTIYFPASTSGTWSSGVWTGSVFELSLTPSSPTSTSEYVSWSIAPVHAIQGSAGSVTITR